MGGGVHIDFNLDFLSADPTSNSAKRTLFGHSRAALPGAMPTWYARFRQYTSYEVGHLVFYSEDSEDILPRDQRSNISASNLYVCVDSRRAGNFSPPGSAAWESLGNLGATHHTGLKTITRTDFLAGDNAIEDNQICLNLFEFISASFIICNSTFIPKSPGYQPIALKPRVGASFGGGVARTRRELDLDENNGGNLERFAVDYPNFAISGDEPKPLPSRKFGYAANSLNAQLGSEIDSLDPKNDPLDSDIKRISFNVSEVYEVGDVVNYYPLASGSVSADENFDTTNHPKIAVCVKAVTIPARNKAGTVSEDKVPWNLSSSHWEEYATASNRPNSSLSSVYEYLVNKKNRFPGFKVNSSAIYRNLSHQPVSRNKARISMNDFGGTSNIYGHFFVHWATQLRAYNRSKCATWYSGGSSQSGPYQDGQYDIFIYTKNLKKDHGGQPRLAVTFGKTTAIKFLSVSGVSTFSTGVIDSNKINQYLKDKNFNANNISTVSSEADIIHYQYSNLVPAYYMRRGYVHSRRRGGVHPGSSKGSTQLGKYILFIEDLLSRQRIEMVTPQIFSNGNPRTGLHGASLPFQDWGQSSATRFYEYGKAIDDNSLTNLLSTKTEANSSPQPMHYLLLGNALSAKDQIQNKGISFQNRFVDRAFRPIFLRTDAISQSRFNHILGLMQTGFSGVDASKFKDLVESNSQNIDEIGEVSNKIWMDLGETFHDGGSNPLFKSMSENIGAFKENTLINLESLASWNNSTSFTPQQITKIEHNDYWETVSSSSASTIWYHDEIYEPNQEVYMWSDGVKRHYKSTRRSQGLSPKENYTFFRAIYANNDKEPVFSHQENSNDRFWTKIKITKNNIGTLKGLVGTINPYSSLRVLANSNNWPSAGRKAAKIGFGWKRTFSEEGILNQITENNQEVSLQPWSAGETYQAGDIVTLQSGPIKALSPDGNYYTYEEWIRLFDIDESEQEEISLIFAEAEAANPLFAFKCLRSTDLADLSDPKSYVGLIPGFIPSSLGTVNYNFISNLESIQRFDSLVSENIISQTIWIELTASQWQDGQIDSSDYERYGMASENINKRDVFGAGTNGFDLSFDPYYQIGDAVVMTIANTDYYKLKVKAMHLVENIPSGYIDGGLINGSTEIETKAENYYYQYNIDFSQSRVSNYDTTSSYHDLIRSQWWQPIARRTGVLNRSYPDASSDSGFYFVVPKSFDYIHLEPGLAEQAKSTSVNSVIKIYFDEVKTFDLRGSAYHWTSDVKNINSNMINILPASASEVELEEKMIAEIEHPYIDFAVFGSGWTSGEGQSPHPLTLDDTDSHEAVKYFKTWLYSNFDVDLARDFNDGSPINLDDRLSDKFDLVNYYSFYSPTVRLKYQVYDTSGSAIGVEQDYSEGDEIQIEKGQKIKIIPRLEKDDGSEIGTFSFICNSFSKNNVLGLYLRTPLKNSQKSVDFNYTFSSSAISDPPIDGDGIRVPFFLEKEIKSGLPDFSDTSDYDVSKDLNKLYQLTNKVIYNGNVYEYKVADNEDWTAQPDQENNPVVSVGRWDLNSWNHPVTNTQTLRTPAGTPFRDENTDQDPPQFKTSIEGDDPSNGADNFSPVFSASAFIQDTQLPSLIFQGEIAVGGNNQLQGMQSKISQSYNEVSIKETLLSRFKKGDNLFDQYGEADTPENDLLRSPPKWRNVNGPEGAIEENEIVGIDWSISSVYAKGEIVNHENKFYISEEINSGINPSSEPTQWRIIQPWHESSNYYEGDYVYIYENTLSLDTDTSGNPLPTLQENISFYGPDREGSNKNTLYPSWSKVKRYEIGELVSKENKVYKCIAKDFAQTELRFHEIFELHSGSLPAPPNYGGRFAFYVCDKNVQPGRAGHNPARINILTSLHGDDEILIRPSDNLSKTFSRDDEVYIDFEYQNGDAFQESTKDITISLFGYHPDIDDREFLEKVQLYPDLAESHPQILSAWALNSSGEGLTSTGTLNIKIRVTNPNPSAIIEREFNPATPPADSTCQTFASSTPSMIYQNKFLINGGKLYASGLDSSEFGFIGLMDDGEFTSDVADSLSEGSQAKSYNKLWSFENISINPDDTRVKIYQNGSKSDEITNKDKVSMVQSEGGNTVFICDGKLYGVGHNQGYSLGLCADPESTFGIGTRADGLTIDQKKSEALQDLMEVFLHFDSDYYLELQSQRPGGSPKPRNNIGDNAVKFGADQDENLMAWSYFMKRGFYQSINSEWEAIGYKATSGEIWGGALNGINYLKKDWTFTNQYLGKWISDTGAAEGTIQYLPHYASSDFWQSGGVHAYNLNKSNPSNAWGVMNIGDLDAYMEVSIFEKIKLGHDGEEVFPTSFKEHIGQVKWKEAAGTIYHGTVDYKKGGVQPRIGWNGILLSHAAVNDRYPITENMLDTQWWSTFKTGRPIPVAGATYPLYNLGGMENGDIQAAASSSPTRSFYNNMYIYPSDPSTGDNDEFAPGWDNLTPGQALYIDGKPFWNPVLGNPDHILLDWACGEYHGGIDGENHWVMGLYKLKSKQNITWGNYPRFSKFEDSSSIISDLNYSEMPGGSRFVDGLSGTNKQVIHSRTYVPYATQLVDEDVSWAATNKYSTFYVNTDGEVKALGSVCACPAYKVQGFDIPEDPSLTLGGRITSVRDISIQDYDNFGSLNLKASWNNEVRIGFPIVSNDSWYLIRSDAGNKPSTNLGEFMPEFFGDEDISFGEDISEYNFRDVITDELIVSGPGENSDYKQNIVNFIKVGDLKVQWNEVQIAFEISPGNFTVFNWWRSCHDNESIVKAAYRMILKREADSAGLNYYKTFNLTFYELTRIILGSEEYANDPKYTESPIPSGTEKMMAIFNHYGNTAPLLTNGAHSIRLGRFKGAFIMEGCEREEVNGVYLPSLPQNEHLPSSFGLASSEWYQHPNNVSKGTEYNIYESMHNTELGKILVYWDPLLKLWRMQYSDLWKEDDDGQGYRVQLLIGMQVHWADSNATDGTGYLKSTKSNLKTPADVEKWFIGTGDWKNQNNDNSNTTTVQAQENQMVDSTRVVWSSPNNPVANTCPPHYMAIIPPLIDKTEGVNEVDLIGDRFSYYSESVQKFGYDGTRTRFEKDSALPIRRFTHKGDGDIEFDDPFVTSRKWLPVHWTDRFMSVAREGGDQAINPATGQLYPNINSFSSWDSWPQDVDFVNEFEENTLAVGTLANNPGGAWKESLIYSSLDRKPDGVSDGLDLWRFSLPQKSDVIFSAKLTKSGDFTNPEEVKFGLYVYVDQGYSFVSTYYFWGMFNGDFATWNNYNMGISQREDLNDASGSGSYDYRHPGGGEEIALQYDPTLLSVEGDGVQRWFLSRFWRQDNYYWPEIDDTYERVGRWTINGDFRKNNLVDYGNNSWTNGEKVYYNFDELDDHFRNKTWRVNKESRGIYPGIPALAPTDNGTTYAQLSGTDFIDGELRLSVNLSELSVPAGQGVFVMLVAEHGLGASQNDLDLINPSYEISSTVVSLDFAEPMFLSDVTTNLINFQSQYTNQPEYAGEGHPFEHDTGDFNENPLNYKFTGTQTGIYDWHASLTDWDYYLDSQPGLEDAMNLQSFSKSQIGFIHWNMPLSEADRANRSVFIKSSVGQRVTDGAAYFRGLESMRHNTNWFYDDLIGWVTKDVDAHSPDSYSINNPYPSSPSEWMFSAKYGNWFSINQENKNKRAQGLDFDVKFINHNFNFIQYSSSEQEFNSQDIEFTRFSIIDGQPINGYIPQQSALYTKFDSYTYNYGDIVKIELAEGADHYRTLYFMSNKDNNKSNLGFIDSLAQDEIKEFNIPAPKALSKRYAVETNTSIDDADLSGAITIYDPADYGGDKASRVSMGESHAIILTESGKVYGVGDNSKKQIDKIFQRNDQFYNLNPDTNFGTTGLNGYEFLERTTSGNSNPNESMSGWKVINKPLFAINQWNASKNYNAGDQVFIKKETVTAIISNNLEFNELANSAPYTNHPGVNPHFVNLERQAKRAQKNLFTDFICENSIADLFNRSWANGQGRIHAKKDSMVVFSGIIPDLFKHKSLKHHYRESRGDARFLTQDCYLKPHRIDNFSKHGVIQNDISIKNIKCSGYGSLFLDSTSNLYGIGNNEISKSKRSEAFPEHNIGSVFGISSNFLDGPEFLKNNVSFMHKNGDFVSYISNGYAYKAGGANLFPYFENYQNSGAEALVLNNEGNPLAAKMIFIDGPKFWDHDDWFLKRFLSQKINNKFYLMDEYYKPSYADRCSLNSKKGQYLSNVFALPAINEFVKTWEPGGHYKEIIKEGEIMDAGGDYARSEREDDSTKFKSVRQFESLPSCFESRMPSLVSYQGKIYQCIKSHGREFGTSSDHFNIDDRVGRKWWEETGSYEIPGESSEYWKEISDDYNKNMVQFLSEKLKLFNLSGLSYVDNNEEFWVKGFLFGISQSSSGRVSGIEDNSKLISYERGAETADRSPESRTIIEKYWNQDLDHLSSLGGRHNPYIPKWNAFLNLQDERIGGWTHPVPKTENLSNTLSGGRSISFIDMLSANRKRGMYWIGAETPVDFSELDLVQTTFQNYQSDLEEVFSNNVHGYQFDNFVAGLRAMEGWKQGVSAHFRQGRPFMDDGAFGESLNLIWPTVDPFANSIFLTYRGEYKNLDTNKYSDESFLKNQGLDLSAIDISTNPRNYKTNLVVNEKNPYALFEKSNGEEEYLSSNYNNLDISILRTPSKGLYSWWDIVRDMGSRLKDSFNFSTNSSKENPFASFSFMEHYFSQHNPSSFPVSSNSSFLAGSHISELISPWDKRDDSSYFNPWGNNNFINRIAKSSNWHIQDNMQTIKSHRYYSQISRNIFSLTLREDLASVQSIVTQTYNQSLYFDFLEPKLNEAEFSEITAAYNDLLFFNTASHHMFLLNSYILDPASLPLNKTIPKWGFKINDGEIQEGSSYSIGDRVFHAGYPFISLQNSNSSTPVVGDYYDSPTTNASWKYEEPMDLHRYRSQILFAHGITLAKLTLNLRQDEDPYGRDAFIPQETIGHSQIDFSFVSKNPELTNFHNFRNHNLMRRAAWEQVDSNDKLPYENMENKTHPLAEGEDINADPLLSQSTNKKGYNVPTWFVNRDQHWTAIWNDFVNSMLPTNGNWFDQNNQINMINAEAIVMAYGWRDARHLGKPSRKYAEDDVGAEIDWDTDKAEGGDWFFLKSFADNQNSWVSQTYVPDMVNDPKTLGGFILGNEYDTSNMTDVLGTDLLDSVEGDDLTHKTHNAGYHGYISAYRYLQSSESEVNIKNVYYKFPKPAFPSLYGNVTDYMECISELYKFGFSKFTNGQNSTHKIWGRELNHDFYCSSKINSKFYSTNRDNYLVNKIPSGQNKMLEDSETPEITSIKSEYITAWSDSNYYLKVSGTTDYWEGNSEESPAVVTLPGDLQDDVKINSIYIKDRSKFFADANEAINENSTTSYDEPFRILYKMVNTTTDTAQILSAKVHCLSSASQASPGAILVVHGYFYYFMENIYYYCGETTFLTHQLTSSQKLPSPGESNDSFKFIASVPSLSPSSQQVPIYDTDFEIEETLTEVSGKKLNLFEDFPAAVKNLRHLRFEVKPVYAMEENFHGENQVYTDTLNVHADAPDGTRHIHQGFINHNFEEGTRQWVLEGGLAGIILSDYFDIFKEGYSYKQNKQYSSAFRSSVNSQGSSICLAQVMSIALGDEDRYGITREEAKEAAEEYVIGLAKQREGLDYVWYDLRLEAWVAGRNWLHENINGLSYPSESIARDAAHDHGLSDQSLISWETEYIPRVYRTDGSVQKDFDKFISHDVIYIGGKEHHQCLARIHGVIKKWQEEIELVQPGILNIENGQLFFGLLGTLLHVDSWTKITGISFDIS